MSRKNKILRAFLYQNPNPTVEQAWDAAWKHAQKTFHARSMQDMEEQLEIERDYNKALVEALGRASSAMKAAHTSMFDQCLSNPIRNAWGQDVDLSALNDLQTAASLADAALAAYRKGGDA